MTFEYQVLYFAAIVIGFVLIPGPATILTVTRTLNAGIKVGVSTAFGIAIGDLVHTTLVVIGLTAVVAAYPILFSAIKYAGAAYLFYVGIRMICAPGALNIEGRSLKKISPREAMAQAITIEVLNPKTALFFLSLLPQFVVREQGFVSMQLLVLGLVFVALSLASTIMSAIFAQGIGNFLQRSPVVNLWKDWIAGCIFCALGLRLVFQDR